MSKKPPKLNAELQDCLIAVKHMDIVGMDWEWSVEYKSWYLRLELIDNSGERIDRDRMFLGINSASIMDVSVKKAVEAPCKDHRGMDCITYVEKTIKTTGSVVRDVKNKLLEKQNNS